MNGNSRIARIGTAGCAVLLLGVGAGVFLNWPKAEATRQHTMQRDDEHLILASQNGYQTVSMLDGGRTGLYYDAAEDLLRGMVRIDRIVLLGMGGGEMLKAAHRAQPRAKLIGVEIDEQTIEFAQDYFHLSEVDIYRADALKWITAQRPESISVVMVDLYNDNEMVEGSTQAAFFLDCALALRPYGLFIMNVYPASRVEEVELQLEPFFVTARKTYGPNIVITGMKRP